MWLGGVAEGIVWGVGVFDRGFGWEVVLGGGLACFWWRVGGLLMMPEWDVAGRCCAGRGWWCAMAWIFWEYGLHTFAAISCSLGSMLV